MEVVCVSLILVRNVHLAMLVLLTLKPLPSGLASSQVSSVQSGLKSKLFYS